MKIEIEPDDVEMSLRIDGGDLSLIDEYTGIDIKIVFSESDMEYLKKRLNEWNKCDIEE